MKIAMRMVLFLVCWALWMFPAIGDLKESGPDFSGITALFLSFATSALICPLALWVAEEMVRRNGGLQIVPGFSSTLFAGISLYLMLGIIYHLAVKGYGGSSWYRGFKNIVL